MELNELEAEVGVEVPGAALFAVRNAIRAAAREFFVESRAWRVDFGPVPLTPHVTPEVPVGTFLVEATRVEIDDRELLSGQFATSASGGVQLDSRCRGYEVAGEVAVAPSQSVDEIPDHLGNEFRDALVVGALSRLMRIPQAEWSNPQMAVYYQGEFEEAKVRAATRAENGFVIKRARKVRYGGL